jgi:hypothetical protein
LFRREVKNVRAGCRLALVATLGSSMMLPLFAWRVEAGAQNIVPAAFSRQAAPRIELAQAFDGTPIIMAPEPGTRPELAPQTGRRTLPAAESASKAAVPPNNGRRGSSSPSPLPPPRSIVTPLGQPSRVIELPRLPQPSSPAMIVPGVSTPTGPAMTPPRPPGQSFQDRAVNCVHAGGAIGVSPGQIGAYTQSCVNQ